MVFYNWEHINRSLFMFINDSLSLLNSLRGSFKLIKQMAGVRPLTEEEKELMSLYGKPITVYDILQAFSQDKVCTIFLYFSYNILQAFSQDKVCTIYLQAFIICHAATFPSKVFELQNTGEEK